MLTVCFLVLLMGCSGGQNEVGNIPKEIRSLDNLTVYARPENPDTLLLHRKQTFGNSQSTLIGRIVDVAVDRSGRVFIADIQQQSIHVFNAQGDYIKKLGRSGEGPGEFSTLKSIQIQQNNLYAFDPQQHNVSVFSPDSLAIENTIFLTENRENYQGLQRATPWINNLYKTHKSGFLAGFKINRIEEVKPWKNFRTKVIFYPLAPNGEISTNELIEIEQPYTMVGPLSDNVEAFFGSKELVLSSDDNIYVSEESDHFLIKIYNKNGTYLRSFYYPHSKVPLTQKSASKGGITGTHFVHEFLLKHMKSMDLPDHWPVLNEMKIDDEDRLWLSSTIGEMNVNQWWVLGADGKLIARFTWPKRKQIDVIKNGYVYVRGANREASAGQVEQYRIEILEAD